MRVYVRTNPALIRAVLLDADATTNSAAAARAGIGPDTITQWRRHAARLGDWPNDQDVEDWHAQNTRREIARARDDRYRRRRYFNQQQPLTNDPTGCTRRLRALYALGWTWDAIAAEAGRTKHQVWRIAHGVHCTDRGVYQATVQWVHDIYERLCMTRPEGFSANRARNNAARKGWAPPLAWHDIDDPDEQPTGWEYKPADRAEVLRELAARGVGVSEVCRVLDLSRAALQKWCGNNDLSPLYRELVAREDGLGHSNQYRKDVA